MHRISIFKIRQQPELAGFAENGRMPERPEPGLKSGTSPISMNHRKTVP